MQSIPSQYLADMLGLIPKENSFRFVGKNYLQVQGTAMETKAAIAFANIFMWKMETEIGIELANNHHPTIFATWSIKYRSSTFKDFPSFKMSSKHSRNYATSYIPGLLYRSWKGSHIASYLWDKEPHLESYSDHQSENVAQRTNAYPLRFPLASRRLTMGRRL